VSTNKHTPGPWIIDAGYLVGVYEPDSAETIAVFDCEPSEEDARLIAAAPDLLAALIAMHQVHRAFSSSPDWTSLDDDARLLAESAIAKAKGE
jgi:hypothetical protein